MAKKKINISGVSLDVAETIKKEIIESEKEIKERLLTGKKIGIFGRSPQVLPLIFGCLNRPPSTCFDPFSASCFALPMEAGGIFNESARCSA